MAISLNQHKANITKKVVATFEDVNEPKMGLSVFFPSETTIEKQIGIEVRRNRQLVASDVLRGTGPNLNTFDKYTEKLYVPPLYDEGFNFTDLDRYDVTFGERTNPSKSDAINMINESRRRLRVLKDKIQRAIEIQRSQALQTGIVTLKNADNIDFKRKAASLVVNAAPDQWNQGTSDPVRDLETGAKFLKREGLSSRNTVHCIMGEGAFREFMRNQKVVDEADVRRISRIELGMPKFDNTTGLTVHGTVAAYDFNIIIWTYSDFYETDAGVKTPYIDDNKVIMIADDFEGRTNFAGVPAIKRDVNNAEYPQYISRVEADFYVNNYIMPQQHAHWFELLSAPIVVPFSIDRIWTAQVLA